MQDLFTHAPEQNQAEVEYRPVVGCLGYRVGADGSLWSCWRSAGDRHSGTVRRVLSDQWKQLKPDKRKVDGRKRYTVKRDDGTYKRAYASHFVLEAFVGPCPPGMEACHGDGDCLNDAADNLRWDTSTANKADMVKHGTRQRGEQINTAKLTEDDVREIRRIGYPLKQHAVKHNITEALACQILKGKVWKHVE